MKKFPELEKRKYYFDEFIIGNIIFVSKLKYIIIDKIIYKINKEKLGKKIKLLGDENKEISNKCILYLNNKKIDDICYVFSKIGHYKLKLIFKQYLIDMSYMFSNCSSLTSLNLSNFNTNNVTDMRSMFLGVNKTCNLICNDKNLKINNFIKFFNKFF